MATPMAAVAKTSAKKSKKSAKSSEEVFKKADLVQAVSEMTDQPKTVTEKMVNSALSVIIDQVAAGKKVQLAGFGNFAPKERAARKGRNPQTGEELDIPASTSPGFTASKAFKDQVNGK